VTPLAHPSLQRLAVGLVAVVAASSPRAVAGDAPAVPPPPHHALSDTRPLDEGLFDGFTEADPTHLTTSDATDFGLFATRVEVHRFLKPSDGHALMRDKAAGDAQAGYRYEGVQFLLLDRAMRGTVALRDCQITGLPRQFISVDPNCEGQSSAGILGYAFTAPGPGRKALVRCFSEAGGVHLLTANPAECDAAGYRREMVVGYGF
jgi:hypothetical protein